MNDAATIVNEPGEATPAAGNVSLCFYCGHVALFTGEGVAVREPSPAERDEILREPDVARWLLALREHGPGPTS